MSDVALGAAVAALRVAYPRQDFPDETVSFYVRMLQDLDGAKVASAVERLVRRCTWLPSIAEIRIEVAEEECQLPSPAEAWSMVSTPVAELPEGYAAAMPEIVKESMNAMGGRFTITHSENLGATRAQFNRDYEERRQSALLASAGALARDLPPAVGDALGHTSVMQITDGSDERKEIE